MTIPLVSASGSAKLAIAVSIIAFASLFAMVANVDNAIQGDFNNALKRHNAALNKDIATTTAAGDIARNIDLAASEDVWLGHAGNSNTVPVAFKSAIEIGDTLTITTKQGKRVFNVEAIAALPENSPSGTTSTATPSMFVLTAREAGRTNGFVMRLLVEDTAGTGLRRRAPAPERNL